MTPFRLLSLLLPLAWLAACSSADPKLYTLAPTTPEALVQAGPSTVVELRRVDIPGYMDRAEVVRSSSDYRVHLAQNERWSEPLGDMVQRVLTQDLARRLPGATVYSDAGSLAAEPTVVVTATLGRLDADGAGQVVLEAQYAVRATRDGAPPPTAHAIRLTAPIQGTTTADYAAALSAVCGQLADALAAEIR